MSPEFKGIIIGGLVAALPVLIVTWINIRAQRRQALDNQKHQERMVSRTEIVRMRIDAVSRLVRAVYDVYMTLDPVGMGAIIYSRESRQEEEHKKRIKDVDEKLMALQDIVIANELALGKRTLLAYHGFRSAYEAIRTQAYGRPSDEFGCHHAMLELMNCASEEMSSALVIDLEESSVQTPSMDEIAAAKKSARERYKKLIDEQMKKIRPDEER